jgi:hypothetical protein
MFLYQKPVFDSIPSEDVGNAVKAAFQYFEDGCIPELAPLAQVVFAVMKPCVDESILDYNQSVRDGKRGGRPQKGE